MRATVNMSPLIADSRSTPTDGAEPSARSRPVMGWPWPCAISFSGVIEKLTPRSTKALSWASVRLLPCTILMCGPTRPARHQGLPAARRLGLAAALMHGGDQAHFLRQGEIVGADLERGIVRTEHRHAERDQRVAIGQRALQQALDLAARVGDLREMRLAGLGIGLGRAVEEGGADAAFLQRGDAGIGVRGRRIVVRPVHEGRHAVIELVERARQGGDVDVLGHEYRGEAGVHMAEVFQQGPVGRDRTQRRLPGVHVGVYESRQDEVAGAVDRLGVGVKLGRDRSDAAIVNEHVARRQHAELGILRDDDAGFQEEPGHGWGRATAVTRSCSADRERPARS